MLGMPQGCDARSVNTLRVESILAPWQLCITKFYIMHLWSIGAMGEACWAVTRTLTTSRVKGINFVPKGRHI